MTLKLEFEPGDDDGHGSDPTQSHSVVSLAGTASTLNGSLTINVDLGFDEFWTQGNEYGLGCTKADVIVAVDSGEVDDWARFQKTAVDHKLGSKTASTLGVEFKPTLAGEVGGKKIEVGLGGISREVARESADEASYTLPEERITARHINGKRAIKWTVDLPRSRMAFRNWIVEAINFWSKWNNPMATGGYVRVRYDMQAFNRSGRRIKGVRRWIIKFFLSEQDKRVCRAIGSSNVVRRFGFRP